MNPPENERTLPEPASGVSRRTVVKGAAWAVPAVAVASAVPAFAASPADVNLAVASTDCSLISVNILSDNAPGFTYTATQGTVPAGTQITVTTGGTAAVNIGNFDFEDTVLSVVSLGGNGVQFDLLNDLPEGQSFTIGLTGLTVNVIGTYTTNIITPDAVQDDDIAIMTAGGVGVGTLLGAFVCFDPDAGTMEPLPDLPANVVIDFGWCETLGIGDINPSFVIQVENGTIPAGTRFLLYSSSALNVGIGTWTFDASSSLSLDLLGTGTQAAEFAIPREVTTSTPLTVAYEGVLSLGLNTTYYLAYLGNDSNPADNAKGMTVTAITVVLATVASCQQINN